MRRRTEREKVRDYLWRKIRAQLDAAHRLSWNIQDQAGRKREHICLAKQLRALRRAA